MPNKIPANVVKPTTNVHKALRRQKNSPSESSSLKFIGNVNEFVFIFFSFPADAENIAPTNKDYENKNKSGVKGL